MYVKCPPSNSRRSLCMGLAKCFELLLMMGGGGGKKKELIEADVGIEISEIYPNNDETHSEPSNSLQYRVGNRNRTAAPTMPSSSFRVHPPKEPTEFTSPLPLLHVNRRLNETLE